MVGEQETPDVGQAELDLPASSEIERETEPQLSVAHDLIVESEVPLSIGTIGAQESSPTIEILPTPTKR